MAGRGNKKTKIQTKEGSYYAEYPIMLQYSEN